eukprot:SAG31_NODE_2656_length_5289_cov_1.990366_2_plen_154_part_00
MSELDFYRRELARATKAVGSMRLKLDVTNGEARQAAKAVEALHVAKGETDEMLRAKDALIMEAEAAIEILIHEQEAVGDENKMLAEKLQSRSLEVRKLLEGKSAVVSRLHAVQNELSSTQQDLERAEAEAAAQTEECEQYKLLLAEAQRLGQC